MACWLLLWLLLPSSRAAAAGTPNTVAIWNRIAEDAVIRSTPFQNEGLIYMAYVSAAVYDAVVAIEGGYAPYGGRVTAPPARTRTRRWSKRLSDTRAVPARAGPRWNHSTRRHWLRSPMDRRSRTDCRSGRQRAALSSHCVRTMDGRRLPRPQRFRSKLPAPASGGSRRPRLPRRRHPGLETSGRS